MKGFKEELTGIGTDFLSGVRQGFSPNILTKTFESKYESEPPREWRGKFFKLTKKGREALETGEKASYLWYLNSIWDFGDIEYNKLQEVDTYFRVAVKKSEVPSRIAILKGLIKLKLLSIVS